ncbi:hypothetical protein SAMN05216378_2289 [Paenibacillus catalpae]|uniref:Uncharacterized protein n=1 Tax=Paenibacillus catalpae TaxID=1045775 RepID=A0A1I1XPF1_9BACL|nr:hypothetical protein SAMN05216378_2289 [Paenibacillus catalpae]
MMQVNVRRTRTSIPRQSLTQLSNDNNIYRMEVA